MNIVMLLSQRNGKKFALAFLFFGILDNFRCGCIIFISAHGASYIWIPARVADAQPAGGIPDAVAGNGDAEKRVPASITGSNEPSISCWA